MKLNVHRRLLLPVGVLGVTSIVTQTILLREFLSVFSGNELVIGIVLGSWMILTGAGSFLGRSVDAVTHRRNLLLVLLVVSALFPPATVFLLHYLRNIVFPVGSMIGITESLYSSFILLMPFCLVSGFLFTFLAALVSEEYHSNRIADVYAIEAAGSMLGGLLFNLVAVFLLKTFQALLLLSLLSLCVTLLIALHDGHRIFRYSIPLVAIAVLLTLLFGTLDERARRFLFADQELLLHQDTPYGNLTVTKQGDQSNFYENSVLLFSTNDPESNEEAVHYAMIQHPRPKTVLLIAGGISGTTEEILKYGVDRIDYVELNPRVFSIAHMFTASLVNPRIRVIAQDARMFVRETPEHYDVALINVPDPGTAQINRYYTVEFLRELKAKLTPGAVVSLSLLSSVDYLGPEARQIGAIMLNTLNAVFRTVLVVPGQRNYYLASDSALNINISAMIARRGIATVYVNKFYVDDQLLKQRSDEIMKALAMKTPVNMDFTPVAYYRQLLYWLSYFNFDPWIPTALGALLLGALLLRLHPVSFGMFTGGFAASSMELLLIVAFQVIYGYVYQATGLIITLFMAGLAAGAWYERKRKHEAGIRSYVIIQCAIGLYAMVLPSVLLLLKTASGADLMVQGIFLLLTFVVAALIGAEFTVATQLLQGKVTQVASRLYGIDLIGSASGALFVAAYLLPLLGIAKVGIVVAVLCFASAAACGAGGWKKEGIVVHTVIQHGGSANV